MRLLERSPIAQARLEDAEAVRDAYASCRDRARVDVLRLMATPGPDKDLRAAEGRLAAAELQLGEARRGVLAAWTRYE